MRLQALRVVAALLALLLGTPAFAQLRARVFASGYSLPLGFVQDPSDAAVQYVVEQGGRIKVIHHGNPLPAPFLDLSGSISCCSERGLLGLAFPPNYAASRHFFVFFTAPAGDLVVARFSRSASDRFTADPSSRFNLRWSTGDPFILHRSAPNHNGGCLAFGPDGFLYISTGDGGGGNDPDNNGQNPATLLGKVLRIDVTSAAALADPDGFVVPEGNPGFTRPEIWSMGWRNPWRFSFDSPALGGTGAMIVGDVGQGAWEEIDYEPANRAGRNYGWRYYEGFQAYIGTPPASLVLTPPLHAYGRTAGRSVTGGYVYRGSAYPDLRGRYFFGDYVTSRIWSVALSIGGNGGASLVAGSLVDHTTDFAAVGALQGISSFGVDMRGELYVVDHRRGLILALAERSPRPPTGVRITR